MPWWSWCLGSYKARHPILPSGQESRAASCQMAKLVALTATSVRARSSVPQKEEAFLLRGGCCRAWGEQLTPEPVLHAPSSGKSLTFHSPGKWSLSHVLVVQKTSQIELV